MKENLFIGFAVDLRMEILHVIDIDESYEQLHLKIKKSFPKFPSLILKIGDEPQAIVNQVYSFCDHYGIICEDFMPAFIKAAKQLSNAFRESDEGTKYAEN